jgi:peptide/nickel transport system permease protein
MGTVSAPALSTFSARPRSLWRDAWKRLVRNRAAIFGGIVVLLLIGTSLAAPLIAPYDPLKQNLRNNLLSPSPAHWFGTDVHGRDIFSRVLYGAAISLRIGFMGALLGGAIGVVLGLIAGFYGGWADMLIMRLVDIQLAFPGLLLAIAIITVIGPGLENVIIAVSVFSVPTFTRVVRGSVLSVRQRDFIMAAHTVGARNIRIMRLHLFPNILAPVLVLLTMRVATAILTAASLSFLGLGAQPPIPEWGAMLSDGRDYLVLAPHVATFPGLAILLAVLGFNLLGDGLRDALDPRMRI